MDRIPITQQGYEQLRTELKRLKTKDRYEVAREIEEARAHGDLSENAEYEAAKDKQGHLEARIRDLEDKLARADVIDPTKLNSSKVVFGATVDLEDLDTGEELQVQIVGPDEGDAKKGKISVHSPLARALIGKEEDDEAVVKAPGGTRSYGVKAIRFGPNSSSG
jgi:transcription elongation factor GreA